MATIQGIYVAIFGRPADPAGLAHWNAETNNGADLSKMINALSSTDEFKALYDGKTNAEIITAVYQSLFGRAPDAAGLEFYLKGLEDGTLNIASIAVSIVDGAQDGDKAIVDNKVAAADLFTESLDTQAEIDAYVGTDAADAGRAFLAPVTGDPETIPTQESVDETILTVANPDGGQTPGGGGGGGGITPPPSVSSFDAATGTLTVAANADASLTTSAGNLTFSATGFSSGVVNAADVQNIVLSSGSALHSSASTLDAATNLTSVSGAGTLDVQGVTFANANPANPVSDPASFEPSPSLDSLYNKVTSGFTVNGNEADTIKAIWDVLDDRYVTEGFAVLDINTAFVNLGIRYVEYLENGGEPFTDLIAKADPGGRSQSMHDNLLGNVNSGVILGSRFNGQSEAFKQGLLDRIPPEYEARAVFDGNPGSVNGSKHDEVREFDAAKGWDRPDYVTIEKDLSTGNDVFAAHPSPVVDFVIKGLQGDDTVTGGPGNDLIWGDGPDVTGQVPANFGDDVIDGGLGTNAIVLGTKAQDIQLGGQDTVKIVKGAQGDDVIFNFNFGPTGRYDDIESGGSSDVDPSEPGADLTFDILKATGYSSLQEFYDNVTIKIGNDNSAYLSKLGVVLGGAPSVSGNTITTAHGDIYSGPAAGTEFELVMEFSDGGSVTFANAMSRWEKAKLLYALGDSGYPNPVPGAAGAEDAALNGLTYADGSTPTTGLVTLTEAQEMALVGVLLNEGNLVLDGLTTI